MPAPEELTSLLSERNQEHLLVFWDELDDQQRNGLAKQISEIDFALLDKLISKRDQAASEESAADRAQRATSPEQLVRLPKLMKNISNTHQPVRQGKVS